MRSRTPAHRPAHRLRRCRRRRRAASRVHPSIHLEVQASRVTAAEISFAAPFPVRGAAQNYAAWSNGCGTRGEGDDAAVFNHNVVKGGMRRISSSQYPFAARCSGAERSVEILFDSSAAQCEANSRKVAGELLLASAAIRLPRGDEERPPVTRGGPRHDLVQQPVGRLGLGWTDRRHVWTPPAQRRARRGDIPTPGWRASRNAI